MTERGRAGPRGEQRLGHDGAQIAGEQAANIAAAPETFPSAGRPPPPPVRMHRYEDQMASIRQVQRNRQRLQVAHLADQDDIETSARNADRAASL